jgi:hypothetical protein
MAIEFPTFSTKERLTAEKLNAWVSTLEDKFNAGFGSTDITWPLLADNNLNMGTGSDAYAILGGSKIMKVVNAASYATLEAACAEAGSSGAVFIPPDTTVPTDGATLPATAAIIGAGPSSVIKANAGATYIMQTPSMGKLFLANLKIDGNSASATAVGLRLVNAAQPIISNVIFDDCGSYSIELDTTPDQVVINGCQFHDGGTDFIYGDSIDGLSVTGCVFEDNPDCAINLVAAGGSTTLRNISIVGNYFFDIDDEVIKIIGSGSYNLQRDGVSICNNQIDHRGDAGDTIVCGSTAGQMQNVNISGNNVTDPANSGISVYARYALISNNNMPSADQHGCDCTSSAYMMVNGNNFYNASNVGVRAVNVGTDVVVSNNNVLSCNTGITYPADITLFSNAGAIPATGYYSTNTSSLNIPANSLEVGSRIVIQATLSMDGGTDTVDSADLSVDSTNVLSGPAVDTTTVASSDYDSFAHLEGIVTDTTTIEYHGFVVADDSGASARSGSLSGLSFSSDIAVGFSASAATYTSGNLSVKITTAEEV